jgi:hypothetical protein
VVEISTTDGSTLASTAWVLLLVAAAGAAALLTTGPLACAA